MQYTSDPSLILVLFLLRAIKQDYVVSVVERGRGIGLILESDLDGASQGIGLGNRTDSVLGLDRGINGRSFGGLLGIGLILILQATHQSAATARYLTRIKGEVLLLSHFDRYLNEIGKEGGTAEGTTAGTESAHYLGFVTNTDLAKLDSGLEYACKILYKLSEVNSVSGGEIEEKL